MTTPSPFSSQPPRPPGVPQPPSASVTTTTTTTQTQTASALKPKKKFNLKMILGGLVVLLLIVGAGAGYYLTQVNQDVRQQAYGGGCTNAGAERCVNGKKEVCNGTTWGQTNISCTTSGSCNPSTHCCNQNGCTRYELSN